jgi:hypothetical protein
MDVEAPMTSESTIKLAARLYQMRDAAKTLLRDKYNVKMAALGQIISESAAKQKRSPLLVANDMAQKGRLTGVALLLIMAAAVELLEPSA